MNNNDALVELIYNIPLEKYGWKSFSQQLNQLLNTSAVHIVGMDFHYQAFSYSQAISLLPNEETASIEVNYLQHFIQDDPRWTGFLNNRHQGWYQCHDYFSDQEIEALDLYHNILVPSNIRYSAVHALIFDEHLCVIIAVNSSKERGPLNQLELEFLDQLLIHLKRVAAIQRHIFEFSAKAIMGYALVDKLSQPIILLDLSGKVLHLNSSAQHFIQQYTTIQLLVDHLVLPEPYQAQLKQNLKNIEFLFRNQSVVNDHVMQDGCIKIVDHNGENLFIFATVLISEHEMKAFGVRPSVMLTFYHLTHLPKVNSHLLNTAFNLTAAESKVALLLLDGFLPKEIAQKNKVNLDTIRKQLQSIYKKTSTRRQSELVKLLLSIPY